MSHRKPDFGELIEISLPALKSMYRSALDIVGLEAIYAVVLTTYSSNEGFGLHVNTEESLEHILNTANISAQTRSNPISPTLNYYRWYWGEWGDYEFIGDHDLLNPVFDWLTTYTEQAENFGDFKDKVHQSMITILQRLDDDNLFGVSTNRDNILVYAGVYDDCEKLIFKSAQSINSSENWVKNQPLLKAGFG